MEIHSNRASDPNEKNLLPVVTGNHRHPDEDTELTEQETHFALLQAKIKKAAILRQLEYAKKLSEPKIYPILDANALYSIALARYRAMIPADILTRIDDSNQPDYKLLDEYNDEIFKKLCLYFAGDERCETQYGMSLRKGIALLGPIGCRKTTIMRCFAANSYNSFSEVSCRAVADDYSLKDTGGALAIEHYSTWKEAYPENFYGQKQIGFLFDDLGTERVKKHYGNEINVMEEIILNRYDNRHLAGKTHFTSNLSADDMEDMYGRRFRSRVREMFNWITFDNNAPDKRS